MLQVLTKDGVVHQGYERRTRESQETGDLVMRELAAESLVTVREDQIESRSVLGSSMPVGLIAGMTRQQLSDLIRYLSRLGSDPADK